MTLILAHGAGAPQRHPFMVAFAHGLSERGLDVLTFNFLYTEQRRKVPDRMPQLAACYRAAIDVARAEIASARERLFIGGKSMGGRAATHVAAEDAALTLAGIVLLGYPLHPPGRPDQLRDAHLPNVGRPMLFVQGTRDTFGTPAELKPFSPASRRCRRCITSKAVTIRSKSPAATPKRGSPRSTPRFRTPSLNGSSTSVKPSYWRL